MSVPNGNGPFRPGEEEWLLALVRDGLTENTPAWLTERFDPREVLIVAARLMVALDQLSTAVAYLVSEHERQ
jgi:hypothetical protein